MVWDSKEQHNHSQFFFSKWALKFEESKILLSSLESSSMSFWSHWLKHSHGMHASVIFLARWVEVGHQVTDVFIFVKEKEY